jgi:hypothetical protein
MPPSLLSKTSSMLAWPTGCAVAGAVEDHVGHGLAAQVLGRALAHDPAHGVDDVGLATAVGADDGAQVARQRHRRRVDEGLESGELDRLSGASTVGLSCILLFLN